MRQSPGMPLPPAGKVASLEQARIQRALRERVRYRYVQPQVLREGSGWRVRSPCCSRNVDPAGGPIDVAWLQRLPQGGWRLHARDHARSEWRRHNEAAQLAELLDTLCLDPQRIFWP
ncbi:hypothetical protein [Caldimonas tepidiphila]|uniref:DUF3024 domain-containing protein n=1 Tax=Caldimonas tepidiphila TaxID=2315841 RepID=UPI000E5AC2A3|nr:hypothetical protein [Caldimonas tepidiphila]